MFSKHHVLDAVSSPRNLALDAVVMMADLFLHQADPRPESVMLQQAQAWATIGKAGVLAFMILSSALVRHMLVHSYMLFLGCASLFIGSRHSLMP